MDKSPDCQRFERVALIFNEMKVKFSQREYDPSLQQANRVPSGEATRRLHRELWSSVNVPYTTSPGTFGYFRIAVTRAHPSACDRLDVILALGSGSASALCSHMRRPHLLRHAVHVLHGARHG